MIVKELIDKLKELSSMYSVRSGIGSSSERQLNRFKGIFYTYKFFFYK